MDLQDHLKSDWSQYYCPQPLVEFDTNVDHHLLCSESRSSPVRLEDNSDPYCSIWADAERGTVETCNTRSFALDARIRLDSLKSGCNSPSPCSARDVMLYNYNCQNDTWDSDESQDEECALDVVKLLDIEDDVKDEERWLYESPKKQVALGRAESALGWCRHVLDNRSPETEAACRLLINKLEKRSSSHFCRRPALFHHTDNVSVVSSLDKTSVSTSCDPADSIANEMSICHDSITTSYRLQDITDVHIMARIQEASLRQDYVSTPAHRRGPESPTGLSSDRHAPASAAKQGGQSPKQARLHQQVTQYKLLKLAQNQAASPARTRSPLRTSLRSLQAVRNSRSLEIDNYQPAESPMAYPPLAASSVREGSRCWSPSFSAAPRSCNGLVRSAREPSDRMTAVKKLQRSQSVSPCRIPHPAKGYLSVQSRVFASPERSTSVAWGRNVPSTHRWKS